MRPGRIERRTILYDNDLLEQAVELATELTFAFKNGASSKHGALSEFNKPLDKARSTHTLCDIIIHLYVMRHGDLPNITDYKVSQVSYVASSNIVTLTLAALNARVVGMPVPFNTYEFAPLIEILIQGEDIRSIKDTLVQGGYIKNHIYRVLERLSWDIDITYTVNLDETAHVRYDFDESENNELVDYHVGILMEALEEYPELEILDRYVEHDCVSVSIKWVWDKPITLASVTIPANKRQALDQWKERIDKRMALEQLKDTNRSAAIMPMIDEENDTYIPYTGASGGALTYMITPTSLGHAIEVKYFDEVLDLTDYDDW
jgi:hypothetical protein